MFRTRFALPLGHERRVLLRDGSESSGRTNVVSSYRSGVQAKRRAYEQRARRLSRPRGAERVPHTLYQMRTRHKSIQAKGPSLTLLSHLTFESFVISSGSLPCISTFGTEYGILDAHAFGFMAKNK